MMGNAIVHRLNIWTNKLHNVLTYSKKKNKNIKYPIYGVDER